LQIFIIIGRRIRIGKNNLMCLSHLPHDQKWMVAAPSQLH
jgi:hypothetical protein